LSPRCGGASLLAAYTTPRLSICLSFSLSFPTNSFFTGDTSFLRSLDFSASISRFRRENEIRAPTEAHGSVPIEIAACMAASPEIVLRPIFPTLGGSRRDFRPRRFVGSQRTNNDRRNQQALPVADGRSPERA